MKITVVGTGYVGLANAILLSQNNNVGNEEELTNAMIALLSDKDKATHICSYIANMTDTMAVEDHQKLFNITYRF